MQKLILSSLLIVLCSGCAFHRTLEINADGERTSYVGISIFNKTAVTGLTVGKRTEKGSVTLSLSKGSTETQAETVKAAGEALGEGIASGVKKTFTP